MIAVLDGTRISLSLFEESNRFWNQIDSGTKVTVGISRFFRRTHATEAEVLLMRKLLADLGGGQTRNTHRAMLFVALQL